MKGIEYTPNPEVLIYSPVLRKFIMNSLPIIFNNIIEENRFNRQVKSNYDIESFPSITLKQYIRRLIKLTNAENSSIIHSLILIDRLNTKNKLTINEKNIHKLFFISLLSSIKLLEDRMYVKEQYILASGLSDIEISLLEYDFITDLDYDVYVKPEEFNVYLSKFEEAIY